MEAKKLTDNCYLISDKFNNKLGLTFSVADKVLFTYDFNVYDSIEDIAKKQNDTVLYTELTSTDNEMKFINEYPIRHDSFVEVEQKTFNDEIIHTYKTSENSNSIFCAGWWVIATASQLRIALSPKFNTLSDTSIGPFKNKFDCRQEMNRIKIDSI